MNLKAKAKEIRNEVIRNAVTNNAGHIAPSLSCLEILVALYYSVMKYKPGQPAWDKRDRLVLSKAHGCYALYCILADLGFIPRGEWNNFYTGLSTLKGCVERNIDFGLELGCGSLGHGLPVAVGMAYGAKLQHKKYRIFCVVGDGEMQEGSNWEAIQFAVKHGLDNLSIIVDKNKLQAMDFIINVLDRSEGDLINRLRGFGLRPVTSSGNDAEAMARILKKSSTGRTKIPSVIVAKTTKGCGLKCMEGVPKFHYRVPTQEELCL